jgi:cysteine desulfurase/selenocysteine lyase
VPWQLACERKQAHLKVIPITEQGELVAHWPQYFNARTKLLAITHVSNAIGTVNPLAEIIQTAHAQGIPVLVDGAQSAPHLPIDVQKLDCDFFVFSGHKIYGPTGIAVLYGKSRYLEAMPPYQGGGNMILSVDFEKSTYNHLPHKFEAGTPPIAEAIGLSSALHYLENIGWPHIIAHEKMLLDYATCTLDTIPSLRIIGRAKEKIGVLSFVIQGIHPHDIGSIVDQSGVAIRTGHHCAMPLMKFFDIPATARASIGIYNTVEDIDRLKVALQKALQLFKVRGPTQRSAPTTQVNTKGV